MKVHLDMKRADEIGKEQAHAFWRKCLYSGLGAKELLAIVPDQVDGRHLLQNPAVRLPELMRQRALATARVELRAQQRAFQRLQRKLWWQSLGKRSGLITCALTVGAAAGGGAVWLLVHLVHR